MALIVKGRDFMWPVVLRENTITVDDKEDYMVSIKKYRSTKTFADVANEISIERTEYRPETVENIEKLAEQKIVEMLLNGNMFAGEYFIYKPSISGVFDSKGEPREGVQLSINVSGTALLREALGEVKFEIVDFRLENQVRTGRRRDAGRAPVGERAGSWNRHHRRPLQ